MILFIGSKNHLIYKTGTVEVTLKLQCCTPGIFLKGAKKNFEPLDGNFKGIFSTIVVVISDLLVRY